MANGRVITGFSKPYVAVYSNDGTEVSYASGQILARGVSVSLEVEAADDNVFYADNGAAESAAGVFQEGTLTLTVDGLLPAAEKLILGLPTEGSDGFMEYGDSMTFPYLGVGFVVRYMSGGVTSYVPVILPKCRFYTPALEAATQEDDIDWQTQELTAAILRDDSENHVWKRMGAGETTEAAAEAKIKTAFSIA